MWEKANTDEYRWVGRPHVLLKWFKQKPVKSVVTCVVLLYRFLANFASAQCFPDVFSSNQILWLIRKRFCCNCSSSRESLCFDSSLALVYVFVAISRIEIQASWGSPGWSISWLCLSAKNGERGASEGSAQLSSAHWSAQETLSMGTHQGAQTTPCGGNLLIKTWLKRKHTRCVRFYKKKKRKWFCTAKLKLGPFVDLKSCHKGIKNTKWKQMK